MSNVRPLVPVLAAVLGCLLFPPPAEASKPTLAVTYFDNNTSDQRFDPLGRGLADMLITDLAGLAGLDVVERGRLNDILGELDLQASAFVDPDSAVAVGKGLGAQFVLTGSFAAIEPEMRIDARVVNVSTGAIVQTQSVQGPAAEFFLLEKELATELLSDLELTVSARESARLGRIATEDFDAFVAYSQGLDALDRGALDQARERMTAALDHDDRFALASDQLDGLQDRLRQLSTRGSEIRSETTRRMLSRLDALEASGGPWDPLGRELSEFSIHVVHMRGSRDIRAVASRLLDLRLPEELKFGGEGGLWSINEWALTQFVLCAYYLGNRAEFLSYGEALLERYPTSTYASSIQMWMAQLVQLIRDEEAGQARISEIRAAAGAWSSQQACLMTFEPSEKLAACSGWVLEGEARGLPVNEDAEEAWARAAAHAGEVETLQSIVERNRSRDRYSEAAEEAAEIHERLVRARARAEELVAKLGLEAQPTEGLYQQVASALVGAGRHGEAREVLDRGFAAFPGSDMLHRLGIHAAVATDDLQRAEALIQSWESASGGVRGVDAGAVRDVRELRERTRSRSAGRSMELFKLGTGYTEHKLYKLAADSYLTLGREFPGSSMLPGDQALSMAGNLYRMAFEIEASRQAYQEVVDRYPGTQSAATATTLLETLPE